MFVTDRLLDEFSDDEVTAVMAHEIAHRKKHHILLKLATVVVVMVAASLVLALLALVLHGRAAGLALAITLPGCWSARYCSPTASSASGWSARPTTTPARSQARMPPAACWRNWPSSTCSSDEPAGCGTRFSNTRESSSVSTGWRRGPLRNPPAGAEPRQEFIEDGLRAGQGAKNTVMRRTVPPI